MRFCLMAIAVVCAGSVSVQAQTSGGDMRASAQNPVANVISVPFQNNTAFGVGPGNQTVNVLNIQPVIPFKVTEDINVITRTIVPLIYVPGSVASLDVLPMGVGRGTRFGLGDINFSFYFTPARPGKIIWGAGPSITVPSATDGLLGSKKWSAGPAAVILMQPKGWTVGVLVRQLWSFAGRSSRADVNQGLIQPFVNMNLTKGWYLASSPVITVNWQAARGNRWLVPIGGGGGRLMRLGKLPVNISLQAFYNVARGSNAPKWSLRFQMQFLFPK
jgi:hypothetical protein